MDVITPIILFGCCFLIVLVIIVIVAANFTRRREGPRAEAILPQLAKQMGLMPLDPQRPDRFSGMHQDRAFYIEIGVTGSVSSRNISLSKAIAVSVEVHMKEPKKGYAYCNRGRVSASTSFDSAFSAKLQYEWISSPARDAMLAFVHTHEDLFLEGLPIHPKPQAEPDAKVRLLHNIPNNTPITTERALAVLDELIEVAHVIEATC